MGRESWTSQRIALRRHPDGRVSPTDFAVEDQPIPQPGDGEFLVRILAVSVDPMLRIFIDPAPMAGAMPPMPVGSTVPGAAVGEIVETRHSDFAIGDIVEGRFGWQHFALSNGAGVNRVDARLGAPENALAIGGLPGFTAYAGLEVADLKPGQTILVSGAAGAVGSAVGALVKARGIRAVGIAGGEEKRRYLLDNGYDAVADRLAPDFKEQLAQALPQGANVYFDNVGGPMLADILPVMAPGGLILVCGLMAGYQGDEQTGRDNLPALLRAIMFKGLRIQAFSQYGKDALRPAFDDEVAELVGSGKVKPQLHIEQGLERLPHALAGLFERSVPGKVVVRVAEPSDAVPTKIFEESE
ncbi:zinc-binding dehydrogenase [Sphingobium tyrosinilyticum]|uniref:Zinc-binding dehydrogenase n=1 Tax=Sphingobium tyrosinilyticum TaxID=2715436 RepID=A0ABV9F523_9SPHN